MDDESWIKKVRDDGIELRIGKHSKRLFGIEIGHELLKEKGPNVTLRILAPEVSRAIDNLGNVLSGKGDSKNYEVAKKAMSQIDQSLLQNIA